MKQTELAPLPKLEKAHMEDLAQPPAVARIEFENPAESLIARAIEAGTPVESLERLMNMRRELRAEKSKSEFDRAMAEFQSECPIIQKKKSGARNAYRYAPLDSIVSQVRDLIRKHGFSYKIDTQFVEGLVRVICIITHEGGHSEHNEVSVPIDSRNTMMTEPQKHAGSITFAKRYAFCNGFGILTADEDIDGAGEKAKPAGPSSIDSEDTANRKLVREIWSMLPEDCRKAKNWDAANDWLWREEILDAAANEAMPNLRPMRLMEVIEKLAKGAR